MANKMTHTMRAELANAVRRRYRSASIKEKRKILDEFIATTGYHEKSAIRVLNAQPTVARRQTRQRPSLYDEAARAALIVPWEAADRVCGKRLRSLMPILLPALEYGGWYAVASKSSLTSTPRSCSRSYACSSQAGLLNGNIAH